MQYQNTVEGRFVDRPNRFIAHVKLGDQVETVHVKNTGRCRELLVPGARVILEHCGRQDRKTAYDLVAVEKPGPGLINIDSQAPNKAVGEWLARQGYDRVRPEFSFGGSRIDFCMEKGSQKYLLEVKGCTLEIGGQGYFPDAPTARGAKHLQELTAAVKQGWKACLAFVIQMEGIWEVFPYGKTDPDFEAAFYEAIEAGVEILYLPCQVTEDSMTIKEPVYLYRSRQGLFLTDGRLTLQGNLHNMLARVNKGRLAHEMLARAAKRKESPDGVEAKLPLAVDCTAGLGEDAFLLAAAGYRVLLYEKNPVISALLADALRRAREDPELTEIAGRMETIRGDSIEGLEALQEKPDLIYLDPMFPAREKSGMIKKKFQLLQQLEEPCSQEEALLSAAISADPAKIIIKRPAKGPLLGGRKPSYFIKGESIRYDVLVLRT